VVRPPREVPVERFETPIRYGEAYGASRSERKPSKKPSKDRVIPAKTSVRAEEVERQMSVIASEGVVPFAQSPVDITSLQELLQGVFQYTTWIVSPRTNPFLLVEIPAGYPLFRAVQGVGEGVPRGRSDGCSPPTSTAPQGSRRLASTDRPRLTRRLPGLCQDWPSPGPFSTTPRALVGMGHSAPRRGVQRAKYLQARTRTCRPGEVFSWSVDLAVPRQMLIRPGTLTTRMGQLRVNGQLRVAPVAAAREHMTPLCTRFAPILTRSSVRL
jgi:hypothetical protein